MDLFPTPPDMSATGRHGYAVFSLHPPAPEALVAWLISPALFDQFPANEYKIVNVQNGKMIVRMTEVVKFS